MCSMTSDMITNDWGGISKNIGQQIAAMLRAIDMNETTCSTSPRNMHINNAPINIPQIPRILAAIIGAVSHLF